MKQLFLLAALAVGAAGCADDLRPVQIGEAKPLDQSCSAQSVGRYAGSIDLAALDNGALVESLAYVMEFTVASQLEAEVVEVGGGEVADETRNNFIIQEIEYTFESTPPRAIPPERVPAYGVIPVGSQDSRINIVLTPPGALQAMRDLVDSTGAPATLLTSFRLKGKLASGVETESDAATFPITFFNSGFICTAPAMLEYSGPCGGPSGIDGPITCAAPATEP